MIMNTRMILGLVIIVLVAVALYLVYNSKTTTPITNPSTPGSSTVPPSSIPSKDSSIEMSSVLGEGYSALIQEELNKLSMEQKDFDTQTMNNIANDMSQFYYS